MVSKCVTNVDRYLVYANYRAKHLPSDKDYSQQRPNARGQNALLCICIHHDMFDILYVSNDQKREFLLLHRNRLYTLVESRLSIIMCNYVIAF